jgi:hypothetical protein
MVMYSGFAGRGRMDRVAPTIAAGNTGIWGSRARVEGRKRGGEGGRRRRRGKREKKRMGGARALCGFSP